MGGGRELRSRSDFLRPLAFSLGKKTRHAMEVGATRGSHLASQGGLCLWVFGEFALQSYKKHLAWLGLPCLGLALRLLNCSALQLLHLSCRGRARGKPQSQHLQREGGACLFRIYPLGFILLLTCLSSY